MYTNKNRFPHPSSPLEHSATPGETQLRAFSLSERVPFYRVERYVGLVRKGAPLTVRLAVLAALILLFAYSFPLTGVIANEVVYDKVEPQHIVSVIAMLVVLSLLITTQPLAIFTPKSLGLRRRRLQPYGVLTTSYSRFFHQKWIEKKIPRHETPLGSSDIQPLADLGNSFELIKRMQIIPIAPRSLLRLMAIALLPMSALLFKMMFPRGDRRSIDESSHMTA